MVNSFKTSSKTAFIYILKLDLYKKKGETNQPIILKAHAYNVLNVLRKFENFRKE